MGTAALVPPAEVDHHGLSEARNRRIARAEGKALSNPSELAQLGARVGRLEKLLVGGYALIVGMVLLMGLWWPFLTEDSGRSDEKVHTVMSFVFAAPLDQSTSDMMPLAIATVIGFVGLLLVVSLLLFVILPSAARRSMTDRLRRIARALSILGIVGSAVVIAFSLIALSADDSSFGWGGVVLLVGMLLTFPFSSRAARPLLSSEEEPRVGG